MPSAVVPARYATMDQRIEDRESPAHSASGDDIRLHGEVFGEPEAVEHGRGLHVAGLNALPEFAVVEPGEGR
jgi:hypothetical protein